MKMRLASQLSVNRCWLFASLFALRSLLLAAIAMFLLALPVSAQQVSLNEAEHVTVNDRGKGHKPKPTPTPATGGDPTWLSSPSTGDWNTAANWTPATVPNSSTAVATFGVSNTTNISLSSFAQVSGITFNSGASAFTISTDGGILEITGTGITNNSGITQNFVASGFQILFHNSATAGSKTVYTANGGNISFSGTSTASSATLIAQNGGSITFAQTPTGGTARVEIFDTSTLDLRSFTSSSLSIGSLEGNGNVLLAGNNLTVGGNNLSATFSGVISESVAGGSLTKTGTGTLTLSGANTYSGGTSVSGGGILNIQNGSALGSTPSITTVSAGSTLQIQGGITVGAEALTIGGGGAPAGTGALENVSGTNNYGGLLSLSSTAVISSDAGTLNLTNTGTITGPTFTLTLAGAGNGSIASIIGTTSGSLIMSSTGTWSLSGANTYTGGTTVNLGTLQLTGSGTLGATSGALTVNGGTLDLGGTSQGVGNLTGTGGTILNNGGGAVTLTIGNSNGTGGNFQGVIADHTSGTGTVALTKTGTGKITLSGANSYSGLTTISAGTLNIQNATALGATTNGTTVASGATLQIQGGISVGAEALTISGTGASGSTGVFENVSGTNNYAGLLTLGAASTISSNAGTLNLTNTGTITGSGFNLTLTGPGNGSISSIIGTTSGTLTKSGTGTWILSGANTYTGLTTVSAGILNIQNDSALGGTTNGTTVSSGATLQLEGGITVGTEALTISGTGVSGVGALENVSGTNNYGGLVTLGAASTISSDAGALSLTNTGTITGATFGLTITGSGNGSISSIIGTTSGTLTKSGTGTWTLLGANTYTGLTTVSAGILNIQNATALGTTASGTTVSSGATLQVQGGISVGAEALTIHGTGASGATGALENVSGTNSYGGLITLGSASTISSDAGTLNLTNAGTITGATFGLTLTGSGGGSISSIIGTTSGTLTKSGTGTWTLSGANTYTGATTVNAGTLDVNGSLASGSAVTVNNSGSVLGGTGTINGSVSMTSSGAILEGGTGSTGQTLTIKGALTQVTGSIIEIALGSSFTHSTLALTGAGASSFYSTQQFSFIELAGVTTGTYQDVITGVTSNPGVGSWTINNSGWTGSFFYDSSDNGIDVILTKVPEPGTWVAAALALISLACTQRRRLMPRLRKT